MPLIKVLHIDDKPEMIDLIRLILSKAGYEVTGALDGKNGLKAVETLMPDVVLLDLMMPDIDGWEVFRLIKANPKTSHIPVIVLTARAQSIDKVLGLHIAKVDDYITKPFNQAQVLDSLKRVLAARHS
ncbi:MAG: response regulator transcription factor [Aggregatilineales bacterium]